MGIVNEDNEKDIILDFWNKRGIRLLNGQDFYKMNLIWYLSWFKKITEAYEHCFSERWNLFFKWLVILDEEVKTFESSATLQD
jgi:hypothetical protein